MATLEGTVALSGLPPHRGLVLTLVFFPVEAADSPAPYDGDPPVGVGDSVQICEAVDLDQESNTATVEQGFCIERLPGYYFVQLRAILFRKGGDKVVGQLETFFFGRRPVQVTQEPLGHFTLPVSWPQQELDELYHYQTFYPRRSHPERSKPWWQFW